MTAGMANGNSLTLLGTSAQATADPAVQRILDAWPEAQRPPVRRLTVKEWQANPKLLEQAAMAWLVVDDPGCDEVYDVVGALQERQAICVISQVNDETPLGEQTTDGALAVPFDADPAAAGVMLSALWSQTPLLRAMRAELKLLRLQGEGVTTQINKIDEELRLAAQLQREFLPRQLPMMENIQASVLYRPAGYVSGDIYDIIRLDEDHVGFFVADAVGHGVPAALMTMFIKRCLHTKIIDRNEPAGYRILGPNESLSQLNKDMLAQEAAGKMRFATACYGIINCKTLRLRFARAGHPYPMLLRGDGGSEWLEPEGPVLGIFEDEPFEVLDTQLKPGDRLLLYSDGFEVAFPARVGDGTAKQDRVANDRFHDEFRQLAHVPFERAIQRLSQRLDEQAGSLNQRDDLTAICIGINEQGVGACQMSEQSQVA